MSEESAPSIKQPEVDFFPWQGEAEVGKLQEIVGDRGYEVKQIGDAGYMIVRPDASVVAEAPWILIDFDDTAAQTTHDKKDRCWTQLENMGLSKELVGHCDKISRVDFGEAGVVYQPELEMRLVTRALELVDEGKPEDEIVLELSNIRKEIVFEDGMDKHGVADGVRDLYEDTRYSSTLYPDVGETIHRLHGGQDRPSNVAILTYGDPHFQFSKTVEVMDENPDLCAVFLTKTRKGDFFKALMDTNPFAGMELVYAYSETPRGVGIDFKNWHIMVTLFDDDPKQVASFNSFAKKNGIAGLGVVRVRREGAKRSHLDVDIPRGSAEVRPSDTLLDTEIFEQALVLLEANLLEDFLLTSISQHPAQVVVDNPQYTGLIQAIADRRGTTHDQVEHQIFEKARVIRRGLAIDD